MKVGDLVKLSHFAGGTMSLLRGVIIDIKRAKCDEYGDRYWVLWTDDDLTSEFRVDLEVV